MAEPSTKRYGHAEGITHICYDSKRRLVTCGHDCDVRVFTGLEEDDCSEFSVATETISAITCYQKGGKDLVAIATDDNTVQAYTTEGSPEGLLTRFTSPVTYLSVDHTHSQLAAGSSEFTIKIVGLGGTTKVTSLHGHEAPVLCVKFDPKGGYLASSSCDGAVKIWSLETNVCLKTLAILEKSNDISLTKSLCYLSWRPSDGKVLAIPVGNEVKIYDRGSWKLSCTLTDGHHKENINVVSWSPCGSYIASGGVDGCVTIWDYGTRKASKRFKNENGIGITSLEWDPRGREGNCLMFADREGYVGVFDGVYGIEGGRETNDDPLADDSLLMEGIPADEIFKDDYALEDDIMGNDVGSLHGNQEEEDIVQSRKRQRMDFEGSDNELESNIDDETSSRYSDGRLLLPRQPESTDQSAPLRKPLLPAFSEKQLEVYQKPFQPSATPEHLHHRFMVYNLVGVVRSHSDEEASMIEVEFHNAGIHHTFSIPNHCGYTMAALSEQALVLACERSEDVASQFQCVHFNSWDNNKDWSVTLPSKESIATIAMGDGWIAMATNKQLLRLFTVGGVQKEVISLPGPAVTLAGWGGRLAVVYHTGPGTENVFSLSVWVLDVRKRKQLHSPHILPLTHHTKLEWIGFSEEGFLVSYDTKGIVRILSPAYGGLSWLPVLDTTKQVGNKSDRYFIVGMTHSPHELRAVLCKGLDYPPVHPKPVMSTLPLKMLLCERETEKTDFEDKYLQLELLKTPGHGNETGRAQQLMKLFALACKSDREFRAYEIAGMMPNEDAMNLALTYASRTQHIRLARKISELIQQKTLDGYDSDSDCYETESADFTNQNTDVDMEYQYAKARSETLNQKPQIVVKKQSFKVVKPKSKYDRYMDEIRQGKFLSSVRKTAGVDSQEATSQGGASDMTKELFSDSEGEEEERVLDEDVANQNEDDVNSVTSDSPPPAPLVDFESSGTKRPNPFKVATPVSKRIQVERKSMFLDNISARVENEKKRKKTKSEKKTELLLHRGGGQKTTMAPPKRSSSSAVQSSLRSTFFKKKLTDEDTTAPQQEEREHSPLEQEREHSPPENGGLQPEKNGGLQPEKNGGLQPGGLQPDTDDGGGKAKTDDQKLSSKQRVANFAFKSH